MYSVHKDSVSPTERKCVWGKDAAQTRFKRPDSYEDNGINFSHQTGLFPINLHGLMEGWKGRGNEEEEGEEAIFTSKGSRGPHQTRAQLFSMTIIPFAIG